MKTKMLIIGYFIAFCCSIPVFSQSEADNVCYIHNQRIFFRLDNRWSESRRIETGQLFGLDSLLMVKAFEPGNAFTYDSILWEVERINQHIAVLSKPIISKASYNNYDVLLIDDESFEQPLVNRPRIFNQEGIGYNLFRSESLYSYSRDTAIFFLRGYPEAGAVYLSGSFNNWSTRRTPMIRKSNGWEARLNLFAGKYTYKFIVDGKWIADPDNLQKENDYNGGRNSVVYVLNHEFRLKGYEMARKVFVAGSFNNWRTNEIRLNKTNDGWSLPVFLTEGTHAYKFIADKEWLTDPDNPDVRADASGNRNSFIGIGDTLLFRLRGYNQAARVILTGSFNNWNHEELVMRKTDSCWELPYVMAPGIYEYKFIADGKWITDPDNTNTTGSGDYTNSVVVFRPNHTFELAHFADAREVIVTGSFNRWRTDSYKMTRINDRWVCPVFLFPGKHTYKFLVDGLWMIDPANTNWEENREGTGNSVLWIDP
jgi:hypothetical protein